MSDHNSNASARLPGLFRRVARRLLRRPPPPAAIATHPFDARYGTDTSGMVYRRDLRTGHAHDAFVTAYFGVPPSRFMKAVDRWRATPGTASPESYRFIDIGCGKGRAVLLASRMPFRDVVGIELNEQLSATARSNVSRWTEHAESTTPVSVLCGDAASAIQSQLDRPALLYLYNPFEAPVLRELLKAILARHDTSATSVDLLYLYPEHEEVFSDFPQFQKLWHEQIPLDAEDEGDGISAATDPCSLYRLRADT